ncbi:MAG: helix-turn-helix transcriptional regulator [Nitrospirota bacterium]|nr:helix-turn-helix transcriptional regulator [Nitrospirota bacterium]
MLRMLRTDKGYRLREFAREVGISPAYLSQIERGEARPPREERVRTIALALGQDPELLMAHSGRVSALLCQAIRNSPEDVTRLIHLTMSMDQDQVAALVEIARKLVKSRS